MSNHVKLWDALAAETGIDRHVCKLVVYSMIFGNNIIDVARDHGLEIEDIVGIRMSFNSFVKRGHNATTRP